MRTFAVVEGSHFGLVAVMCGVLDMLMMRWRSTELAVEMVMGVRSLMLMTVQQMVEVSRQIWFDEVVKELNVGQWLVLHLHSCAP